MHDNDTLFLLTSLLHGFMPRVCFYKCSTYIPADSVLINAAYIIHILTFVKVNMLLYVTPEKTYCEVNTCFSGVTYDHVFTDSKRQYLLYYIIPVNYWHTDIFISFGTK